MNDLFERQVAATPDLPAVVDGKRTVSYHDLEQVANAISHRLVGMGIRTGDIVGVCVPRSWEMIASMLGVFRAGGCCLSLDPRIPEERLQNVLNDASPACILSKAGILPPSVANGRAIVDLDAEREALAGGSATGALVDVPLSSLAYIIYTSGSTGKPKGVAMPHRTLSNLVRWHIHRDGGARRRTLQFAAIGFGVSFQEICSTLCSGGTLVIVPAEVRSDPAALLRFMHEARIERLFAPYSVLRHIAEAAEVTRVFPESLREIICAGEPLLVSPAIRAFFRRLPACVLENQYGASETLIVTSFRLEGSADAWNERPPIGRPVPNALMYVLDERGEPAAPDVAGEIHIGGEVLADGYLNMPEITASKFVPDPFQDAPGSRMYKTGDLGTMSSNGMLHYIGRMDDQVKIRGYRVEPGEIVEQLKQHPAVRDALVLARGDDAEGRSLVAFVVGARNAPVSSEELRLFLRDALPEYMVPSELYLLSEFPLLPSGKVDRNALRSMRSSGAGGQGAFIVPVTPTEQQVARAFCSVLALPVVSAGDNFFALGGHSLNAARVALRLSKELSVDLAPGILFENPTVVALGEAIDRLLGTRRLGN